MSTTEADACVVGAYVLTPSEGGIDLLEEPPTHASSDTVLNLELRDSPERTPRGHRILSMEEAAETEFPFPPEPDLRK